MAQQQILRRQALIAFKKLHRTRQFIFDGDELALMEGRKQINENFRKNRSETDLLEIRKMIALANEVDKELRTNVIQARQKEEGVYELRITEGTTRMDNVLFNPDAVIERPRRKGNKAKVADADEDADADAGCCGGGMPEKTGASSSN